jgi:hypothetical protein
MAKEICISSTPHETRLAILEDDQLAEIYYERENEYTLAGSIYNGRVTRVLPGMQSAFVDLGLERDAFLYVTDFIELEDQEETDELEKAAASGAGQAPREVKHPHGVDQQWRAPGRTRPASKSNQTRAGHEHRQAEAARKPEFAVLRIPETPAVPGRIETPQESDEAGTQRWRGRRRRRGGRGPGGRSDAPIESEPVSRSAAEESGPTEQASAIQASEAGPTPRGHHAPVPFVLPGESLSKYGSAPGAESPRPAPAPAAPPRPASTFKPSTLVEAPLRWDGSGLLPGESLSLRRREAEPPAEASHEAQGEVTAAPLTEFAPEETVEATEDSPASALDETESNFLAEPPFEFDEEELTSNAFERLGEEELSAREDEDSEDSESDSAAPSEITAEPEEDADASHRIDPSAPSGFKLFGFGKKKKDSETAAANPRLPRLLLRFRRMRPATVWLKKK